MCSGKGLSLLFDYLKTYQGTFSSCHQSRLNLYDCQTSDVLASKKAKDQTGSKNTLSLPTEGNDLLIVERCDKSLYICLQTKAEIGCVETMIYIYNPRQFGINILQPTNLSKPLHNQTGLMSMTLESQVLTKAPRGHRVPFCQLV